MQNIVTNDHNGLPLPFVLIYAGGEERETARKKVLILKFFFFFSDHGVWWVNLVDSRVVFIFSQLTFFLIKSFNIALIGN
jgi:hypothetical protein